MCTQTALNEITRKVVQAAKGSLGKRLDKVILYGSYARRDYDDESDVDIMILADIAREDALKITREIHDATGDLSLEYDILVSLHVTDCKTFYEYADVLPFYMNVVKDGVEVYAA
ncbi:MAG: nucleotidyltransferase domain-containing protein [Clostridiales Family XIII bacterium]|jgi:predicted nucleotidyltransferase|nr:nucleotidyltransferase domain-containing protein [Clostridiales Family XIII bacterium]